MAQPQIIPNITTVSLGEEVVIFLNPKGLREKVRHLELRMLLKWVGVIQPAIGLQSFNIMDFLGIMLMNR